jgi:hypothetical protein
VPTTVSVQREVDHVVDQQDRTARDLTAELERVEDVGELLGAVLHLALGRRVADAGNQRAELDPELERQRAGELRHEVGVRPRGDAGRPGRNGSGFHRRISRADAETSSAEKRPSALPARTSCPHPPSFSTQRARPRWRRSSSAMRPFRSARPVGHCSRGSTASSRFRRNLLRRGDRAPLTGELERPSRAVHAAAARRRRPGRRAAPRRNCIRQPSVRPYARMASCSARRAAGDAFDPLLVVGPRLARPLPAAAAGALHGAVDLEDLQHGLEARLADVDLGHERRGGHRPAGLLEQRDRRARRSASGGNAVEMNQSWICSSSPPWSRMPSEPFRALGRRGRPAGSTRSPSPGSGSG